MTLRELIDTISDFSDWKTVDQIKLIAWCLHTHENRSQFSTSDIAECFENLDISKPRSLGTFLESLSEKNRPELLRINGGYKLQRFTRAELDRKYGLRASTICVHKLIEELPGLISAPGEQEYVREAILCLKYGAYRAAVIMAWNVAYDHLCNLVVTRHQLAFDTEFSLSYPKTAFSVTKREHLTEIKEFQVLEVCRRARLITPSLHKVMVEKLNRRNLAAHPSGIHFTQLTAEEFIRDLVENVVLKLA